MATRRPDARATPDFTAPPVPEGDGGAPASPIEFEGNEVHTGQFLHLVEAVEREKTHRELQTKFRDRYLQTQQAIRLMLERETDPTKRKDLEKKLIETDEKYKSQCAATEELADLLVRSSKEKGKDHISGLDTKGAFERLYELSLGFLREGRKTAVIAFDLDNFKVINDTIGHIEADAILKEIGRQLQATIRPDDFATRIGGDEFVVLINGVSNDTDILRVVERIASALATVTWRDNQGTDHAITFSAGFETIHYGSRPYFDTIRKAADALAGNSKRLGRNRVSRNKNQRYFTFVLTKKENGQYKYLLDKEGNASELNENTREHCASEVESSIQRITEEILRCPLFDTKEGHAEGNTIAWAKKNIPSAGQRRIEKITEFTVEELTDLLFFARANTKKEDS